jgi:KDO2-lipid IV(A) lauroyltransferase
VPDSSDEQLRKMSKESMRRHLRYWCDAFRMPDWSQERIVSRVRVVGEDLLAESVVEGKGTVVALAHMGNYDHLGAYGNLVHAPASSVAERLKPEKMFEKFVEYRRSIGIRIYPLGAPGLIDNLASVDLRAEHRLVGLIADRDLSARGVPVTFFGEQARMPDGPASLALRTGAPLICAALWYDGPTLGVKLYPRVPIPHGAPVGDDARNQPGYSDAIATMTQAMANNLEVGIREHPTDWHMMQKLWLADLDPGRRPAPTVGR